MAERYYENSYAVENIPVTIASNHHDIGNTKCRRNNSVYVMTIAISADVGATGITKIASIPSENAPLSLQYGFTEKTSFDKRCLVYIDTNGDIYMREDGNGSYGGCISWIR